MEVNLVALLFYFAYPFASFGANYMFDNVGIKLGMSIGNILLMAGVATRLLINESFYFVLLGNFLSGCGSTFLVNPSAKISATWFNENNVSFILI